MTEQRDFYVRLMQLSPTAYVTPVLIAMNAALFVVTVIGGAGFVQPNGAVMVEWGSNYGPLTMTGEWWRLLSSAFLHFGVLHLAFNMWALYSSGLLVERLYGSGYFLALYLFAGVTGSVASVTWNPQVNSAGASGAVFGVFGALLAFIVNKKSGVPPAVINEHRASTLFFIGFNLFNGFANSGIDNAAHLGGLAGGFLFGLILARPLYATARSRVATWRIAAAALLGAMVVALALGSTRWRGPEFAEEQLFRQRLFRYSQEEQRYNDRLRQRPVTGGQREIANRVGSELLPHWDRMRKLMAEPELSSQSPLYATQQSAIAFIDSQQRQLRQLVGSEAGADLGATNRD